MRISSVFVAITMMAVVMAAVYWGTNSSRSLLLLPAVVGLSTLLVDDVVQRIQHKPTHYSFGPVQYGVVLLWLIGGLIGLAAMGLV